MSRKLTKLLAVALTLASVGAAADSLSVPALVGQDIYHAHRALRKLGLVSQFEQVGVDTSPASLFVVASQAPDSGSQARPGDTIVLTFNHPGMLRYWNSSVVPLLGDFGNTVSFYKVQKPPQPIVVEPAGYPAELKQYNFSGTAEAEALVDFDGTVLAARIVRSSGYAAADSSACASALRGSFAPAEHYERPVRVWFPLPYHFQFKEDKVLPSSVRQVRDPTEPP
ncbi:TonB family protein [candidate division WOR-3 bacterium]|nr:TonB family protein [candidate division WOR-3 bacterium]